MSSTDNKFPLQNDAVVLSSPSVRLGYAEGVDSRPVIWPSSKSNNDISIQLKYYFGEFFGLFFILATTLYIFALPTAVARTASARVMFNSAVKRSLDIIGGLVGILLTAPLWFIIPVAIWIDSRGPIFYSQMRVGVNRRKANRRYLAKAESTDRRASDRRREDLLGKPFSILKFRTMVPDAERISGPKWADKNDPRVTRVGAFLRKTRLDEIPQFINILKGDMSLVGPRPERPNFVKDLSSKVDNYSNRLQVKPGLTGLAQVENGYDSSLASVKEKVKHDLHYIRTWSLWSDFQILMRTVVVVVTGRGAC